MGGFRAKLAYAIAAITVLVFVSGGAALAETGIHLYPPPTRSTLSADPAPIPVPSEGRIPVSLRLADSIWTEDGSHPPAATELRFEIDRQLQLDLADVTRCPWAPLQSYPGFDWSSCAPAIVASGRIKWEVAFPEQEAVRVDGKAIVYRGMANQLLIRTRIPAPVNGEVVIPVKITRATKGIYGLTAAIPIPKIAGGSGSLVYLGLRFRKGLFSMACPKRRVQFGVRNAFSDGEVSNAGLFTAC